MPRRPHEPTDQFRAHVEQLSGRGVPHADIARLVGVSVPILHRDYRAELDLGMAKANATVAGRLFKMTETNVAAAIFWAKARMGWREKQEVEVSGLNGGPIATTVDAVGTIGALMAQLAARKAASEGDAE